MRREFSEGTLKCFLERYPHLTKDQANSILTHGKVITEDVPVLGTPKEFEVLYTRSYQLHVTNDIAEIFWIDNITDLMMPFDGYIYKEYTK
jgi:hypothetical protein